VISTTSRTNSRSTFLTAYASYIKDLIAKECHNQPLNYCVGLDGYDYANTSLAAYDLRSWQFQVCTQFGYYQTGYQTGPSIVSKYVNVEYLQQICTRMFPSGKLYSIPDSPRVEEINKSGDFSFPIERLAIIAGERDPWLPVTPAADNAPKWTVTDDHALFIIKDGVHCWDTVSETLQSNKNRASSMSPSSCQLLNSADFRTSGITNRRTLWPCMTMRSKS